jgi:hypothetical protein
MTRQIRTGDTVLFDRKRCTVIRITDCCAVLQVPQEPREFTTLFGQLVRLTPHPRTVRICATSHLPIVTR